MEQTEMLHEKALGLLEYNEDLLDFVKKDKSTADASKGQNMDYKIFWRHFPLHFFNYSVTCVEMCYKIKAY